MDNPELYPLSKNRPMTWEHIVGKIHPEWAFSSQISQRRIRNAAWARGYDVDPHTGIVRRGK